ncbi:MAG: S-methyl-5'-thioinosine phosphorylase [Arenicellales bacterium]
MKKIKTAIIGGSGLSTLKNLKNIRREVGRTPYGDPSAPLTIGTISGEEVVFLPRHGLSHQIPPHRVNYRANIWVLKSMGVERIYAVAATGGIDDDLNAGDIVIPGQLIDYTYGREQTFFDGENGDVQHIDFSQPYTENLRKKLIKATKQAGIKAHKTGVYAATQGPRLETAAEINRIAGDGGTIVGMTGMPEAALAKELEMDYAQISLVVNPAAGRGDDEMISFDDILKNLDHGMDKVREILEALLSA